MRYLYRIGITKTVSRATQQNVKHYMLYLTTRTFNLLLIINNYNTS